MRTVSPGYYSPVSAMPISNPLTTVHVTACEFPSVPSAFTWNVSVPVGDEKNPIPAWGSSVAGATRRSYRTLTGFSDVSPCGANVVATSG